MVSRIMVTSLMTLLVGCTTYGPITATSHENTSKSGKSCREWLLLPIFQWGRNDIQAAAMNGQINKIAVVDSETSNYLIYGEICTIVYGE